ncbi:type II toxin-antitoxin system RelE/ParE family toxin [Noviherbaspirillum sp.]|jgi:hypothetical protein|uniref:type II toxin-antitoxin system RelE/ParE family toxin n=1 Tax=Noviherbaspirillum sp. TaxID=1926288 RepID=UPI0025EF058D|nr:type II toxin-antitoxin system RelE/ParE family toxin [Noviherbaspirillum sp.]
MAAGGARRYNANGVSNKQLFQPHYLTFLVLCLAGGGKIYQKCDNMAWIFRTYVSQTGRTEVQDKVDELDEVVLEHLLGRIRYLANTEKIDWHEPQAKKLTGAKDVYEIRFKADGIQYRPLGYFGPGPNDFTILVWAYKKQNVYTPAEAIKTAGTRKRHIENGNATCANFKIDGEDFPPAEE